MRPPFHLAHVSFRREARWLLVLTVLIPALPLAAALAVPAVARYLGSR